MIILRAYRTCAYLPKSPQTWQANGDYLSLFRCMSSRDPLSDGRNCRS